MMKTTTSVFASLPAAFCFVSGGGIFLCYSVSQSHGKDADEWPYISETGTYDPESCYFTLILNCSAVILFLTVHAYYKHVEMSGKCPKINRVAWYVGMTIGAGLAATGAFQFTVLMMPHVIVAYIAFLADVIYCCLVAAITWKQRSTSGQTPWLSVTRIVMAAFVILTFVIFHGLAAAFNFASWPKRYATISQWVYVYSTLPFILTLTVELRQITSFHTSIEIMTRRAGVAATTVTNSISDDLEVNDTKMN